MNTDAFKHPAIAHHPGRSSSASVRPADAIAGLVAALDGEIVRSRFGLAGEVPEPRLPGLSVRENVLPR